jgi:hypothetical protein
MNAKGKKRMAKKEHPTLDKAEAQLAKRALQQLMDELEELKRHCSTGSMIGRLNGLQGKVRVGITALRDADGNEAGIRKTEDRGRKTEGGRRRIE